MKKYVFVILGCIVLTICFLKANYSSLQKSELTSLILANIEALALDEGGDQGGECNTIKTVHEESLSGGGKEVNTSKCASYRCEHGKGNSCFSGSECTIYDGNGKVKSFSSNVIQLAC